MADSSFTQNVSIIKRCSKCGVEKPTTDFGRNARTSDGLYWCCKACRSVVVKAYRAANPEIHRASNRAWNAANPDKANANKRAWKAANPDKVRASGKAYRALNPDKLRSRVKAWRDANPEIVRAIDHCRRTRKRNAPGTHTAQQVKELLLKQKRRCIYCRVDIRKKYHVDHIVALANGGSNHINNIQLLCPSCNLSKNARDPIEFAQQKGFLL